jgi:hypothetical protein
MSFDIFFVRSRFRDELVEFKSPGTGEVKMVRPQEPLTDSELRAVREVLRKAGAPEPDEHGCCVVSFREAGVAEVYTNDLEKGCMVALRTALSAECIQFLIDLLRAAEWVMFPAMEGNPVIASGPGLAKEFPTFTEVVCRSAEELEAILSGGFDAWTRYRARILGELGGGPHVRILP